MSRPSPAAKRISTQRVAATVLDQIGNTPLLSLTAMLQDHLPPGVEVLAKAEWFNPGGSIKDRAAFSMVLELEREGRLSPGDTIVDASSGNTGIGLAMVAAARGYRLVLALPTNANAERKKLLAAYGAEVVLTSPLEGSDGAIREAQRLAEQHPEWHYLNQYGNDANWRAHFRTTGPEIAEQAPDITHFVATVGTGGTFTGVGRFMRKHHPAVQLVELQPDSPFHGLEGVKHMESALVPAIWDADLADRRLGVPTEAAYDWVRILAADGLLVGPSGGAAVWGAVKVAAELNSGVVVTVFPDSGLRYLSDAHLWERST